MKIEFCTVSIQFPLQGPQGPLLSGSNPYTVTGGGLNKGLFDIIPPSVSRVHSHLLHLIHAFIFLFLFSLLSKHTPFSPLSLPLPLQVFACQLRVCLNKNLKKIKKTLKVTPHICCNPQSKALFDCLPVKLIRVAINNLV